MMDAQHVLLIITVLFLILQFLYQAWSKNQTQKVLDSHIAHTEKVIKANQEQSNVILRSIEAGVNRFDEPVELTKRTYGVVRELKAMHEIRDEDGRPLWYMPKEVIQTQRELVQLTMTVATTQEKLTLLLERQEIHISSIKEGRCN